MADQKPLPRELFSGAQNDILYLIDGRPCASTDCPPHEDGPDVLATLAGSTQWHIDLCTAVVIAYNDHARLRAEVDRLTAQHEQDEALCAGYLEELGRQTARAHQAEVERDEARAGVERLRAELAADPSNRVRSIHAHRCRLVVEVERWHAACYQVGVPRDPDALVRHHRGNAVLAAATDALAERDRAIAAELRRLAGELATARREARQDSHDPVSTGKARAFSGAIAALTARAAELDPDDAVTRVADAIADVVTAGREVLDPKAGA